MSQTIYQKILGKDFDQLGPNLQRAHKTMGTIRAKGKMDIEWGKGFLVRFMCKLNGLPPEGKQQELELEVIRDEKQETWNRKLKSTIFTTLQFEKNGLLMEKDGSIVLGFQPMVENGNLVYEHKKLTLGGIPVPAFMAMKSKVIAIEDVDGWNAKVEVTTPLFGLVLKYEAFVKFE